MKVTDLMVGDLFSLKGSKYKYKIEDIKKCGAINIEDYPENGRVELSSNYILEELQPIPLTGDNLANNGFVWDGTTLSWILGDNFVINFGHELGDFSGDYLFISISDTFKKLRYVHELQHALRLVGLDKLADNFII